MSHGACHAPPALFAASPVDSDSSVRTCHAKEEESQRGCLQSQRADSSQDPKSEIRTLTASPTFFSPPGLLLSLPVFLDKN